MPERIGYFNPQNVSGEKPYSNFAEFSPESVGKIHDDLSFIAGVTAVHGLEPQQIAVNVGLAVNKEFSNFGLSPKPIILPFVPGHRIYGDRNMDVLRKVYTPEEQQLIGLSEDLGHALLHTEFGPAGYQQHLVNVRDHVGEVDQALDELTQRPFEVVSLDGQNRYHVDPTKGQILEINAGSNSTMAKGNSRVNPYEVFPVTFDGLADYISRHNRGIFQYDTELMRDIRGISKDLRRYIKGIILPDIHTLGEEKWFDNAFPEAFITPPWKDKLTPPELEFDSERATITVHNHTGKVDTSYGYNPDKGVIYLNVSGNDMGSAAAKRFVLSAQENGYVVAAPDWLKDMWIEEEQKQASQFVNNMQNVLAAEPNLLFAKDAKGKNLCKAFFMRLGMGSYAYAQRAEVPIIFLGFETLDNPEMKGNSAVIERNKLGIRYTGQPNIIRDVEKLAENFSEFNQRVYEEHDIPQDISGLEAVGRIILLDTISRRTG